MIDTRTPDQLAADFAMYCEAKAEIDETPLDYADWLAIEADAYADAS